MYISVYNLFYTSLPVLAIGILDQDVNDKNSIMYPRLYTPGLQNMLFNKKEFLRSALMGFFASAILFLIPYGNIFFCDGTLDRLIFSCMLFSLINTDSLSSALYMNNVLPLGQ